MVKKPTNTGGSEEPAEAADSRGKNTAREILLDLRKQILVNGPGRGISESHRMSNDDIRDEADQASAENSREVAILLSARNKEKLLAIDAALKKIEEGNYGTCEECGEIIAQGGLKAMPLARYCTACQSESEREMSLDKMGESPSPSPGFVLDFEEE